MSQPIIWTRAAEDWEKDRQIFGEDLTRVIRLPCLRTKPIPALWPDEPADGFVVCFTSQKAVAAVPDQRRRWLSKAKAIMTFGEQTQQAILEQGWSVVRLPASGGQEFTQLLLTRLDPNDKVLVCAPKDPAYPIAEDMKRAGFSALPLSLYETQAGVFAPDGRTLDDKQLDVAAAGLSGVICFCSPSAVQGFVRGLGERFPDLYERLKALAIGPTTGREVKNFFSRWKVIDRPERKLLFAAAKDWV